MSNTLERSQKHLLLEQVNKANTSFIANINTVANFVGNATNISNLSKVGTLSDKVDNLSTQVTDLDTKVTENTGLVSNIDSKVVSLTNRVGLNESSIISLQGKDSALESRIEALEAKSETIPTLDDYYTIEQVDNKLEKKLDSSLGYTRDVIEQKLLKKLDASTNVEKAGAYLKVGSDGNITYDKNFSLNWGNIGGNITDQTDLDELMQTKVDASKLDNSTISFEYDGTELGSVKYTSENETETKIEIPLPDYNKVSNKPSINNVVLEGNLTTEDLKLDSGIILTGGIDVVYSVNTLPASAHWVGAAFNTKGNTLIIIGYDDTKTPLMYKSTDYGKTWVGLTGIDQTPYAICYGNNTFVVTTNSEKVFCSLDDGETWESYDIGVNKLWSNLCYGNGYFIAVASIVTDDSYGVARSINGKEWILSKALTKLQVADLAYFGGKFVVIGSSIDDNYVAYSRDYGVTWNRVDMPENKEFTKIGYLNGSYVILNGSSTDNTVYVCNNDFSTVTEITVYSDAHDGMHSLICSDNDVKIFVGKTSSVMTTQDLIVWDKGVLGGSAEWYATAIKDTHSIVLSGYTTTETTCLLGTSDRRLSFNGKDVTDEIKALLGIA